jgi:hypothetical protein
MNVSNAETRANLVVLATHAYVKTLSTPLTLPRPQLVAASNLDFGPQSIKRRTESTQDPDGVRPLEGGRCVENRIFSFGALDDSRS